MTLSISDLHQALDSAAAIRARVRLQPAGGPGDKVFPPTYATERGSRYVLENRRIGGQTVPTVLLDSVASQANRQEEALLGAYHDFGLPLPYIAVDFTQADGLSDLGHVSVYDAPHRIADALLRDGLLDGVPFRATAIGRSFTDSSPRNATAMYTVCPHALVFGIWDSTGPKGGLGTKFARNVVSEIIGVQATEGKKTASRIDPAQIGSGTPIYEGADGTWEVDEDKAAPSKGKPKTFRPSEINHGNVAPSIDERAGGVSIDYAEQTWVLSIAGLRRLRFPTRADGSAHADPEARRSAEKAARTALAALALTACASARADGYDLRSRCVLVPDGPLEFEILDADGGEPTRFTLTADEARKLLADAVDQARSVGMAWSTAETLLDPMPRLAELIRRSRALQAAGKDEDDA